MTREEICTSKYRKNEYMSTYTTMNGAKIAFKIPIKMKRLLSLWTRVNYNGGMVFANHAPLDQRRSILALQEHLPHSPPSIKQVLHQTELEIPFKGTRECPALALVCGPPAREWYSQVKQLLVEKRDEEVFLPHDTVRDVVRV
jgi:hypothetical protein